MTDPFEFEGDEITEFTAQLPAMTLASPEAYQRGTLLTLQVEVRVRSVRHDEDRKGNLSRKHMLTLEECSITDVLTPDQRRALLDQAETAAQADADRMTTGPDGDVKPDGYTVTEEPTVDPSGAPEDDLSWATGSFPVVPDTRSIVAPRADPTNRYVAPDQNRGLDDDDAHRWMDDDEEPGVHIDTESLKAVVGF